MLARRISALLLSALALSAQEDGSAFFEKNIRPLFVKQCFGCHSSESQPVMGGLRLDDRELAIKGGGRGAAVVPGKPNESLLLKAVLHTAGALRMPPGPKMKDADAALLADWIRMGAPWGAPSPASAKPTPAKFWAFVPPVQPSLPAVKDQAWVRSPIDAFILAGLEAKGLSPARPADKRSLIRRASYDLTGLPPTPSEVQAFLADNDSNAFAKVVDRLLASPAYGERWGRHWLDVARYADSNGLDENLVYRNAWRYRNYVISAFNTDKPYDEFIREQLAGDLLPPVNDPKVQYERWTATGFLSLGAKMLAEDDPVKMEMDIVDEQLDTTSRAFMGLTVGCARCHDHKFDPIPQADYYSLAGIFKSSKTMDNFKVVAKWHEYVLAPKEDRDRLTAHEQMLESKRKEISKLASAANDLLSGEAVNHMGAYLQAAQRVRRDQRLQIAAIESAPGAVIREASSFDGGNIPRTLEKKKSNVPKGAEGPFFAEYSVDVPTAGNYRLDILNEEKGNGTADLWINGVWVKEGASAVQNRAASPDSGGWSFVAVVPLRKGANTLRLEHETRFPYFEKLLIAPETITDTPLTSVQIGAQYGVNPGYLTQLVEFLERSNGAISSVLYAWETLGSGERGKWASPVAQLFNGDFATAEALSSRYDSLFQQAAKEGKDTKDPGIKALYDFWKEKFGPFRAPANVRRYYPADVRATIKGLDKELKTLEAATPKFPQAMGVSEGDSVGDIPIHIRGSHWTLGEKVPRRYLSVIAGEHQPAIGPGESGRLQLAQWLSDKNHPLTSRVMANRIWRWHFGRGIVATVDNFGRLGERPSNQALLDWLARHFMEEGWSVKAMQRTLMLSSTYQMSSEYNARAAGEDPENILLWRMPRRRLEVEAIRDGIMSVSGALTSSDGGTLLPYKDREYVANTARGGSIDYDKPIRAVYLPVVRSSMYDVFQAFDLPDPSTSNGSRDSTVVAPQALFMMNSSVMLQQSRKMADNLMAESALSDADRVRVAFERALARPATPAEIDRALSFIHRMEQQWKGNTLMAWQSFCKALLASNEFIYIN